MPPRDYSFQPDETASGLEAGYDGTVQGLKDGYGGVRTLQTNAQDDEKRKIILQMLQQTHQIDMDKAGYGTQSGGGAAGASGSLAPAATAAPASAETSPSATQSELPFIGGGAKADPNASPPPVSTPGGSAPSSPLHPGGVDASAGPNPNAASGTQGVDQNAPKQSFGQKVGSFLQKLSHGGYEGLGDTPMPVKTHQSAEEIAQASKQGSEMDIENVRDKGETLRESMRDAAMRDEARMRGASEDRGIDTQIMTSLEHDLYIAHQRTEEAQKRAQTSVPQLVGQFAAAGSKDPTGDANRYIAQAQSEVKAAQADEQQKELDYQSARNNLIAGSKHIQPRQPPPPVDVSAQIKSLDEQWKNDQAQIPAENKSKAHNAYMARRKQLQAQMVGSQLKATPTQAP